jgi:hypothetical protein
VMAYLSLALLYKFSFSNRVDALSICLRN